MNYSKKLKRVYRPEVIVSILVFGAICFLLFFHLGSLTHGLSASELQTSTSILGWHGIYHNPFWLALKVIRSIVFFLFKLHTQFLTRLPNAILGLISIISFSALIYLWHGKRTAMLMLPLFACSAWVLHVSRLASFDIVYLWGIITLLLMHALILKYKDKGYVYLFNFFIQGLLLSIPGFIWLVMVNALLQRDLLLHGWQQHNQLKQRLGAVILLILWLPLIVLSFRHTSQISVWLGLPTHVPSIGHYAKNFVAVFVHLFIRGPQYSQVWLVRAPLLDIFSLVMALTGVYYYSTRLDNARAKLISSLFIVSAILVALDGSVVFSLMVPFAYLFIAMGISYLLYNWFRIFPRNPLARALGIGLICLAIAISCVYNLRAYFIAWPHNVNTIKTFNRRL